MTELEFTFREVPSDVDATRALIYLWEIRDTNGRLITCYVGKAKNGASRPRRAYGNNVRRLRAGLGWHGGSVDDFRPIHRAMADAADNGHEVTLTLVCNVMPGEDINAAERRERIRFGCRGR
jgi:hypothetical protein